MLEINQIAPNFTLNDKNGNSVSLTDFRGKKVVLYFYPKDSTPGCTRQALAYAALSDSFAKKNAVIIGVSRDSVASHLRFAQKNALPFILLSDPDRTVTEEYGAWQKKKLYGKESMGVVRTTYIIDEDGVIVAAKTNVKADTNAEEFFNMI